MEIPNGWVIEMASSRPQEGHQRKRRWLLIRNSENPWTAKVDHKLMRRSIETGAGGVTGYGSHLRKLHLLHFASIIMGEMCHARAPHGALKRKLHVGNWSSICRKWMTSSDDKQEIDCNVTIYAPKTPLRTTLARRTSCWRWVNQRREYAQQKKR